MLKGFDTDRSVGPLAGKIVAAGYQFVGRYLKNLTRVEAQELSSAGIAIVSIWERNGDRASFTAAQGQNDGVLASAVAKALGQPEGSVIISAIDYDAPIEDWAGIQDYFDEFAVALGDHGYKAGAYGNGLMLGKLLDAGIIEVAYLAGAESWRESLGFTRWQIRQHPTITDLSLGIEIDRCDAQGDFGAWRLLAPPAVRVPSALEMQKALNAYGAGLTEDNVWGPRSAAALATYYRLHG